jgi:hypothetical protein
MAALGVSMLVGFFICGVVAMYAYYRKMGGAFTSKRFDNHE